MNALEKFVVDMKKSEEIISNETEQNQQVEKKLTDDEERRFSLIVPPLTGREIELLLLNNKLNIFRSTEED